MGDMVFVLSEKGLRFLLEVNSAFLIQEKICCHVWSFLTMDLATGSLDFSPG
jgi:hypothetical protein